MHRTIQLIGIFGIVLFVFGMISFVAARGESSLWTETHLMIGGFLSLAFLFRGGFSLISGVALRRAAGYGAGVTIYSGLCIGLLAVVNYFFYRFDPFYFDSTEQSVYTLAPQTQKVLNGLTEPVLIRAFYLGGKVDDKVAQLLGRIQRASKKVTWTAVDPEKSPRLVEELGISEKGTLHFSVNEPGSQRATKIVRTIGEQEVVNALLKLTRGGEKQVYWVYGHGEANLEDNKDAGYLFLREAIEGENLKVTQLILAGKDKVPDDAAALLMIAPRRALLESEHRIIREYIDRGGNALFLHEPRTVDDIARIVKPLGVEIGQDMVLDQVVRLFQGPSVGLQPVVSDYGKHPVVDGFGQSTVFATMASVRKGTPDPGGKPGAIVTELAFTSKNSWAEKKIELVFSDNPIATFEPDDIKGPVSVAAAYQLTAPQAAGVQVAPPPENGRVLVIGDADFVANVNIRQLFNRDFFLNALNWVVGEAERVSVRPATMRKSVKSVSAEQYQSLFLFTAILLPELLCLWGLTVWWMRRV